MEWRGREWSGVEGRGGKGRAGQGRVPDFLGGLSRVGIHPDQHARGTGSRLVITSRVPVGGEIISVSDLYEI